MDEHLPLIAIEVVMVFGGALAFGWWQLSDIRRERRKREEAERRTSQAQQAQAGPSSLPPPAASEHRAV